LLGVNCRDLKSLDVRPERLLELASRLPKEAIRVAESGVGGPGDCAAVAGAGYAFALVGGALMKHDDPAPEIRRMLAAGRANT
jgi:indole-3-glycerol phosphate synthase